MRTNTHPYDYCRPEPPAEFNATCPKCDKLCYSSPVPVGRLYTCLNCGTFTITATQAKWIDYYFENADQIEQFAALDEPSADEILDALQEDSRRTMHNMIYPRHEVRPKGKAYPVYGGDPDTGMVLD